MGFYPPDPQLKEKHTGPLTIIIHTRGVETYRCSVDLKDTTLFQYIGEACGRIFTNKTTTPSIQTCPANWRIIRFSAPKAVLEVLQVSGENLTIPEDNLQKLSKLLRI